MLLVTKAVSDWFGGGGIADQMIRFNGFPFLEKEDKEDGDHAFVEPSPSFTCSRLTLIPVANVMKKDLVLMPATGVPLEQISEPSSIPLSQADAIGEIVQSTNYQGFPVVRSQEDKTIIGFVRKQELRYALGQ